MEIKTFCSSMRDEMTEWKAKTYDLIRKAQDRSPTPDQTVKASIDDMKAMIDRIEHTVARLEKECPINWDSEKAEIEQVMCDMRERWSEAAAMSPDDLE
jgi:hypothetical protein